MHWRRGGTLVQNNYVCKMFLYKNNFSYFENIWGGPGPPGPHGHDATGQTARVVIYLFICYMVYTHVTVMNGKSKEMFHTLQ